MRSWSDKPRSTRPDWLTLGEEFVSTWSRSVTVLPVALVGDVIIFLKNYKSKILNISLFLAASLYRQLLQFY